MLFVCRVTPASDESSHAPLVVAISRERGTTLRFEEKFLSLLLGSLPLKKYEKSLTIRVEPLRLTRPRQYHGHSIC